VLFCFEGGLACIAVTLEYWEQRRCARFISDAFHATKIYGASVFINLNDFPDDGISNGRVRLLVDALMAPAHVVPEVQRALQNHKDRQ
jgi:hypothetical protein